MIYPSPSDKFRTQDFVDNAFNLDADPGLFVCDSMDRPSDWTSFDEGRHIFETDTGLIWVWDGSDFIRLIPRGHIASTAKTSVVDDPSAWEELVTLTVTVAEGNRPHQIIVSAPSVLNDNGVCQFRILRDSDSAILATWNHYGALTAPSPIFAQVIDLPSDGSVDYIVEFQGLGGSPDDTTITDLVLTVIEI